MRVKKSRDSSYALNKYFIENYHIKGAVQLKLICVKSGING
jgi:hypothetical protein